MQIESLSKRIDPRLTCKVEKKELPDHPDYYWYLVKRVPSAEWKELSPAQVTIKIIDPILDSIANTLNSWEEVEVADLNVIENPGVACAVSADKRVPIRMFISPTEDETEVVVYVDLRAKPKDTSKVA
jgi:hypothetical protein